MKTRLRLMIFLSILVLVSLACGAGTEATEVPASQPAHPPTETAVLSGPPAPRVDLGEVLRQEEGGYTYQVAPGYEVNAGMGIVSMLAEGADPDVGPSISLFGGPPDPGSSAQSMLDQLKGEDDTQLAEPQPVKIGGYDGLAADITILRNGVEIVGRIVTVVTPENQFVALAGGPRERWDDELKPVFEAVLSSITFFSPVAVLEPTESPTQTPEVAVEDQGGTFRQWAVTAIASSQYTDTGWNASQATGAPNVTGCADDSKAWASEGYDTVEWLEVSYNTAVTPLLVNIYETFNPGQIVKVELLDVNYIYHEVYTANTQVKACPSILSIDVPSANYQVIAVRITVDQTQVLNWNEIDAVELVGYK